MATAVDLEELALAGHPFAPTAVTWWAAGPGRGDPARRQDPADGAGRQIELVGLLRERLGEVDRVEPGIRRLGQFDDARPGRVVESIDRDPAAIAVDPATRAGRSIALDEPAGLADRQLEDLRCRLHGQLIGQDMGEDIQALLCSAVQRDRLPRFHGHESDKVAVPLARTESLSLDSLSLNI